MNRNKYFFLAILSILSTTLHAWPLIKPQCSYSFGSKNKFDVVYHDLFKRDTLAVTEDRTAYIRITYPSDCYSWIPLAGAQGATPHFIDSAITVDQHTLTGVYLRTPAAPAFMLVHLAPNNKIRSLNFFATNIEGISNLKKPRFYYVNSFNDVVGFFNSDQNPDHNKVETDMVLPNKLTVIAWKLPEDKYQKKNTDLIAVSSYSNSVTLYSVNDDTFFKLHTILNLDSPTGMALVQSTDHRTHLLIVSESSNTVSLYTISNNGNVELSDLMQLRQPSKVSAVSWVADGQNHEHAYVISNTDNQYYALSITSDDRLLKIANTNVESPVDVKAVTSNESTRIYVSYEKGIYRFEGTTDENATTPPPTSDPSATTTEQPSNSSLSYYSIGIPVAVSVTGLFFIGVAIICCVEYAKNRGRGSYYEL